MKDLFQICVGLFLCNGTGQHIPPNGPKEEIWIWTFLFCISCAFLAGSIANYVINLTYDKFSNFFRNNLFIAVLFGTVLLLLPSIVYLLYNLQSHKMSEFPFVILWSVFAALVANFLLNKVSSNKLKGQN